jgi:hypothetical protein
MPKSWPAASKTRRLTTIYSSVYRATPVTVEDLTDDFIILSYRYAAQVELPLLDVVSRGPRSHAPGPSSRCGCYHDDPHNTGLFRAMLRVAYTR